ncbi:hypothetical protein [Microvirga solisilvae]|uniref:hypothetical protein n=1 Tax=Microvirga solisilvae TaxID=2919498 RepID=UPI001FAF86DC|nr:hypothetical protein [Microvirga solisilvae]
MVLYYADRDRDFGTRVRLFPQAPFLAGFTEPEVVWLSPPAGSIASGPADDRMYVVDAINKDEPYAFPYLPPYRGLARAPVEPDASGHFAHLPPDSRDFLAVHMYGSVRRVLDIFESYLGRRIEWPFQRDYPRLEIIPLIEWDNAQSGYGYIEFGRFSSAEGKFHAFGLNFDVIAHEMGHTILFSLLGFPTSGQMPLAFRAFHEACADVTALIGLLHFDSVLDRLLRSCRGNIYTINELNRLAEISETKQIRLASNNARIWEVGDEPHELSRPLTGACFDVIVYLYASELRERGLIPSDLWSLAFETNKIGAAADDVSSAFARLYENRHFAFKAALMEARDIFGRSLVAAWQTLPSDQVTFEAFGAALLSACSGISGEQHLDEIREIFRWRGIEIPSPSPSFR